VSFPSGDVKNAGSVELKFAWKIIDENTDDAGRYFTKVAWVLEKDNTFKKRKVGLIGMHIGTKTVSSPQWIWATFEHVDNLETNPLEKVHGKPLKPSFYNPESIEPINLIPDTNAKVIKNQIQRVLPISKATQELNKQVQALFKAKKSYWQYYQLIGTQWPTQPAAPPYNPTAQSKDSVYKLPDAVTNKSGGYPVPVYLTNMIMETYFQGATTVGGNPLPGTKYNFLIANEPAFFQIQGFPLHTDTLNTHKMIFGTESCVGCHSSAGVAISMTDTTVTYGNSGDFEWLLQLKAKRKSKK